MNKLRKLDTSKWYEWWYDLKWIKWINKWKYMHDNENRIKNKCNNENKYKHEIKYHY